MEDSKIIDMYINRNQEAITETSKKYGNYIGTIANNILTNIEDTKECVNDTYMKTWTSILPTKPNIFSAFIAKITRNLALIRITSQRRIKRGRWEICLILDEIEECIASIINDFLETIDEQNRIIFIRRYWYAESIKSIATRYLLNENMVKSVLFRSRKKLRIALEEADIII